MQYISRMPVIDREDAENILDLLSVFDEITFNPEGEIMAKLYVKLPVLGNVTISYYDRERHVMVFTTGEREPHNNHFLSNCLPDYEPPKSKKWLTEWVQESILNRLLDQTKETA